MSSRTRPWLGEPGNDKNEVAHLIANICDTGISFYFLFCNLTCHTDDTPPNIHPTHPIFGYYRPRQSQLITCISTTPGKDTQSSVTPVFSIDVDVVPHDLESRQSKYRLGTATGTDPPLPRYNSQEPGKPAGETRQLDQTTFFPSKVTHIQSQTFPQLHIPSPVSSGLSTIPKSLLPTGVCAVVIAEDFADC
ncbi:hypothetical protein WAI453_001945 [Rhynchosporium graminicola]